jgi:osmoprotectant transport system permease protein
MTEATSLFEQLARLFGQLPEYLGGHILLSAAALAAGLVVSVPMGIYASRRPKLAEIILGTAGIVQTVPSLALLALMVPLLGGRIGFAPSFVALTLYSILPILANTIVGIKEVDPALVEAARGLGMTSRQMLLRVQLPLAAPVIIGGIRTATVLVIGTATLSTEIGQMTLGNYIFQGLDTRNHLATVFGCLCAALLAVVWDQIVHLFELAARQRSRRIGLLATASLIVMLAGGLFAPARQLLAAGDNMVVVGSGPFTEQHILSDVLAWQLQSAGFAVQQKKGMGETIQFDALRQGAIDCYVDYSGNIWVEVMKRTDTPGRQAVLDEVTRYLRDEHRVVCLGSLGFEDAYAFAMPRAKARELEIRSVGDLARHNRKWRIGGDNMFFTRPEWEKTQATYGIRRVTTLPMNPTLMYSALVEGTVDVISAYSSDGRIQALDLVLLEDEKHVLPPYDAILLCSERAAGARGLIEALKPLAGSINLETMQQANGLVDQEHRDPSAAAAWLLNKIRGPK